MTTPEITATLSGTWMLGDMTVNRIGFGAMRLTGKADGTPSDRDRAIGVLRRAVPAQVRLAWTLQRGPHVLAIPGTGNPDHLVDNPAAGRLRLSAPERASLG